METNKLSKKYSDKIAEGKTELIPVLEKIIQETVNIFSKEDHLSSDKIDKFIRKFKTPLISINKNISILNSENLDIFSEFEKELVLSNGNKYEGIGYFLYLIFELISYEENVRNKAKVERHHPVLDINAFQYKRNNDSRRRRDPKFSFYCYDNHLV